MKAKSLLALGIGAIAGALLLPAVAVADEILPVTLSFSASGQDEVNSQPKIMRLKITEKAIINLARGRAITNSIPANEKLAAVVNCSKGFGDLVVYDTTGHTNLAVVATIDELSLVEDVSKAEAAALLFIRPTPGSPLNRLDGGFLVVTMKFTKVDIGCPVKIQGSVAGLLEVTVTDDVGTDSIDVLIPKGKMSTGASLGSAP